jgi:hypothetical protein
MEQGTTLTHFIITAEHNANVVLVFKRKAPIFLGGKPSKFGCCVCEQDDQDGSGNHLERSNRNAKPSRTTAEIANETSQSTVAIVCPTYSHVH